MLTTEDIQKLSSYLKEDLKDTFATKDDIKEIKAGLNTLTMAVDSFSKRSKPIERNASLLKNASLALKRRLLF